MRVLIFADEANALGAARRFNRRVDWMALRRYLADPDEGRNLIEMVIYSGLAPNMEEWSDIRQKKEGWIHWMRTEGFLMVTKDGSPAENGRYKANVDVLMAIDAVEMSLAARPDIVVLVTGDADFAHLAQVLRRRGIRVEVAAVEQNLGNQLEAAANRVIDLVPLFNSFPALHGDRAAPIGDEEVFDEALA